MQPNSKSNFPSIGKTWLIFCIYGLDECSVMPEKIKKQLRSFFVALANIYFAHNEKNVFCFQKSQNMLMQRYSENSQTYFYDLKRWLLCISKVYHRRNASVHDAAIFKAFPEMCAVGLPVHSFVCSVQVLKKNSKHEVTSNETETVGSSQKIFWKNSNSLHSLKRPLVSDVFWLGIVEFMIIE